MRHKQPPSAQRTVIKVINVSSVIIVSFVSFSQFSHEAKRPPPGSCGKEVLKTEPGFISFNLGITTVFVSFDDSVRTVKEEVRPAWTGLGTEPIRTVKKVKNVQNCQNSHFLTTSNGRMGLSVCSGFITFRQFLSVSSLSDRTRRTVLTAGKARMDRTDRNRQKDGNSTKRQELTEKGGLELQGRGLRTDRTVNNCLFRHFPSVLNGNNPMIQA